MSVLQWISDNKEWVFSGIGIAAISFAFAIIKSLSNKKDNNSKKSVIKQTNHGETQIGIQNNYYIKEKKDE